MPPSSRTPEGEPLRCKVCGAWSNVEVSSPPGDAICPSCGSHVWLANPFIRFSTTKTRIQNFVAELSAHCRADLPMNRIGAFLVSGLSDCLAAYDAMLWVQGKQNWWSMRRTPKVVACVGERDSPTLAREVIFTRKEVTRQVRISDVVTLVISVPVTRNTRVIGGIEVLQRAGCPPESQQGYVHFINHMADILSKTRMFDRMSTLPASRE